MAETLSALQLEVLEFERSKGMLHETARDKGLLLGEEVGELFKALRQATGMGHDPSSVAREVGPELADVLFYLLAIANRFDIDLDAEFASKLAINLGRQWRAPGRDEA